MSACEDLGEGTVTTEAELKGTESRVVARTQPIPEWVMFAEHESQMLVSDAIGAFTKRRKQLCK